MKARCSYRPDLPATGASDDWGDGSWTVDCSCGVNFDDGEEMVSCDECGVWVHTRCARFVKGEPSFACHNCKAAAAPSGGDRSGPTGFPSDNEETEVAQLLAELPMKTGPASLPPFRKWAEVPLQDRVHVQGVPGGDASLFKGGISSVFNANLWRCTGYVPKKFSFQYREFPCWEEVKDGDSQPNVSQGADALFALSKEAEAAVALPQGTVRKIFKLGDSAVVAEKKDKHRIRPAGDHSNKKRKDGCGETKDHSVTKKSSWDNKRRDSLPIVHGTISRIHEDRVLHVGESVPEEKSETKIGDASEKSTSNDQVGEGFGDTREDMDIDKSSIEKLPEPSKEQNTIEKFEAVNAVQIEVSSKARGTDESVEAEDFAEALHAMEMLKDEARLKENKNEGAASRITYSNSEHTLLGSNLDKVNVKSENVPQYPMETKDEPYSEHLLQHAKLSQGNNRTDTIKDENEADTAEGGFAFRSAESSKHTPGTDESTKGAPKASASSSDPLAHKSCSSGLSRPAISGSLDRSKDPQVRLKTANADLKSPSQDHSSKHPIIYHAKGSASSSQKSSQASKVPSYFVIKNKTVNMKEHVAKPAANVDESPSTSSRSKLGPVNTCQKGERSQQKQDPDACNNSALGTLQMSDATANLSDEQLALLLHQQLNSSPRVPRVPRLRQTPGMQTTLPAATSMLSKRSSASGGRDHIIAPKKKHREETTKERSRESSGMNDGKGSKSGTSQSTSASKDSDKRLLDMPAHQSPTASSTEGATSSKPPVEASCGPGDGTSSKCHTLPGLIDEIFNANPHITYDDLCCSVSQHWSNLRKPNGEKYAYTTPVHAVHDILRNRREWAHLIDQASKTNSSKKRKSLIAEGEKDLNGSDKEKSKNKMESEEEKTDESESNSEDFAQEKRTARKRRRLELRGRSVKDVRRKKSKHKNYGPDDPSYSDSSSDHEGKYDGNTSDDASRAQTAGSSSSD
ncbi:PHD finger protein [Rhynchospora pubera]|uniref:PHD finger protein n=1 Tax=Rhynchospora pubera TaxID=906938 RepID=A0AAV8BVL6_9POAL|nr:PHD finger protein [Rhynchospora pubera]